MTARVVVTSGDVVGIIVAIVTGGLAVVGTGVVEIVDGTDTSGSGWFVQPAVKITAVTRKASSIPEQFLMLFLHDIIHG